MKRGILGLIVAITVACPVVAQSPTPEGSNPSANTTTQRTDDHHNYGWIGLVGLAGLAGLLKKRDHAEHSVRTAPSTPR
jgi:hypothetical protein